MCVRWMTRFAEALAQEGLKPMKRLTGKVSFRIEFMSTLPGQFISKSLLMYQKAILSKLFAVS